MFLIFINNLREKEWREGSIGRYRDELFEGNWLLKPEEILFLCLVDVGEMN